MIFTEQAVIDQAKAYWTTGTTSTDPRQIECAKTPNPTMAYSLAGEGCNVHYGTDPMIPFHLALVFGNANGEISGDDVVKAAKAQFSAWCTAFKNSISPNNMPSPVIRFIIGEASAVCRALRIFTETGSVAPRIPVAQWKTQLIILSKDDVLLSPTGIMAFNVVETSNLVDWMGELILSTVWVSTLLKTVGRSSERFNFSNASPRIRLSQCTLYRIFINEREGCHQGVQ